MTMTRRDLFRTTAGVAGALVTGAVGDVARDRGRGGRERRTRLREVRIPTAVGTFDAVAAGPRHGSPVLLLHGFPEFGIEWSAQLTALAAAGRYAIAPDLRGYSPGVRPRGIRSYHLDHAAADVTRMADALGWCAFDLVGHDWGACAAWIAAARDQRVRTLTAFNVPHPAAFAHALAHDPEQQRASAYMAQFRRPTPIAEDAIRAGGPPKLPGVEPAKCAEYYRRLTTEPYALTAALNWYRANDFTGFAHDLVPAPTLFVTSDDPMVARSGIEATPRWVRGSYRHVHIHGVGHNLPEAAPACSSALILEQVSGCGVAAPRAKRAAEGQTQAR